MEITIFISFPISFQASFPFEMETKEFLQTKWGSMMEMTYFPFLEDNFHATKETLKMCALKGSHFLLDFFFFLKKELDMN